MRERGPFSVDGIREILFFSCFLFTRFGRPPPRQEIPAGLPEDYPQEAFSSNGTGMERLGAISNSERKKNSIKIQKEYQIFVAGNTRKTCLFSFVRRAQARMSSSRGTETGSRTQQDSLLKNINSETLSKQTESLSRAGIEPESSVPRPLRRRGLGFHELGPLLTFHTEQNESGAYLFSFTVRVRSGTGRSTGLENNRSRLPDTGGNGSRGASPIGCEDVGRPERKRNGCFRGHLTAFHSCYLLRFK